MPYQYAKERPSVFTEEGQILFLCIRDRVKSLLRTAGAARCQEILYGCTGDSGVMLACIDRLVEIGELKEVTQGYEIAAQYRIYTGVKL